jgi:hypothetical protein
LIERAELPAFTEVGAPPLVFLEHDIGTTRSQQRS